MKKVNEIGSYSKYYHELGIMSNLPYRSMPEMLKENALLYSERTAISYKRGETYFSLSYAQFYQRVLMMARGLLKTGVQPGDM